MADGRDLRRSAPSYGVPPDRIVSVEHPGIVKDIDRAIATLKGNEGISKILKPPYPGASADLLLRPEDAMSRPLQSTCNPSTNVLLKITVPKWTGRKRKRGSDEPFTQDPAGAPHGVPGRLDAKSRLRSLRDNKERYSVEPVGCVDRTHVFRGMPDFVFSTTSSPFAQKFRKHILPFDFEKMKQFRLDTSKGETRNVDVLPPPAFMHGDIPFQYTYRQNPTVKQTVDTSGKLTTINTQQANKVLTHLVPYDIDSIPSEPRKDIPSLSKQDSALRGTVSLLESLFEERPAWTRRGLRNRLQSPEQRYCLRYAVAYVAYIFRSGPWRDAIIKLGHDPRKSPDYRYYQTFMFRLLPREPEVARDGGGSGRRHTIVRHSEVFPDLSVTDEDGNLTSSSTSHVFTGQPPLPLDGKMWMLCDIHDPLLRRILFPELTDRQPSQQPFPSFSDGQRPRGPSPPPGFLRSKCDILSDGWYGNGTLAKAKTVMRVKIHSLIHENQPVDDSEFTRILSFPEHSSPDDPELTQFSFDYDVENGRPPAATTRDMQLAGDVRATIRGALNWKNKTIYEKEQPPLPLTESSTPKPADDLAAVMRTTPSGKGKSRGKASGLEREKHQTPVQRARQSQSIAARNIEVSNSAKKKDPEKVAAAIKASYLLRKRNRVRFSSIASASRGEDDEQLAEELEDSSIGVEEEEDEDDEARAQRYRAEEQESEGEEEALEREELARLAVELREQSRPTDLDSPDEEMEDEDDNEDDDDDEDE